MELWLWKIFFGPEIFFFWYGIFLLGMRFLVVEIFLLGMWCLVMELCFFGCDFGDGIFVFLVGHEIFLVVLMLGQTLFCRTLRAGVAFKCWNAYGKYCLWILRTSSMKQAFRLLSKLYWTRKLMSTRISSYSFLCQNGFGIPCAHSIFQALVKWC